MPEKVLFPKTVFEPVADEVLTAPAPDITQLITLALFPAERFKVPFTWTLEVPRDTFALPVTVMVETAEITHPVFVLAMVEFEKVKTAVPSRVMVPPATAARQLDAELQTMVD